MAGTSKKHLDAICEALNVLGLESAGAGITKTLNSSNDDPLAVIDLALSTAATNAADRKYRSCLKNSKLGDPVFLSDLYTYSVRQLDLEYIRQLSMLDFIRDGRNLIVWGPPGTGKTWLAKALAVNACKNGISTRWVTYPFLCRELVRLKTEDPKRYESRLSYYAKYKLLCIDEFPNYDVEDKFLMQEFFDRLKLAHHSVIIVGQCSPENWDSLFDVKSFAQSIRGRLTQNAYRLELKGPDLRLYNPSEDKPR